MHVTRNRVSSPEFPEDYCSVITEKWAYSWVQELKYPDNPSLWTISLLNKYKSNKTEMYAWNEVFEESLHFYLNQESLEDITSGSICYMTFFEYLRRNFVSNCPATEYHGTIDNHVFFKPKGD